MGVMAPSKAAQVIPVSPHSSAVHSNQDHNDFIKFIHISVTAHQFVVSSRKFDKDNVRPESVQICVQSCVLVQEFFMTELV